MSRRRGTGRVFSAVARAMFIYLVVAWLLVRYAGSSRALELSALLSLAILAGFPIAALVAARLVGHDRFRRPGGIWTAVAIAVLAAVAAPVTLVSGSAEEPAPAELVLTPAAAGPAILAGAEVAGAEEGLRLRIRGLSVNGEGSVGAASRDRAAEILLMTSVRSGPVADELVVTVRLLSAEDGTVIWHEEYSGDPSDLTAVRRLLIRALTEAMSLTREGVSGGQIV